MHDRLMFPIAALALAVTLSLSGALAGAQSLDTLLRRAAEEVLRNALPPAQPPPSSPPANTPADGKAAPAHPAPATTDGAVEAAPAEPRVSTLETRLADAPRTVDLRQGTPPALADRFLPEKALIVVSNPYVPHDRRFLDGATAMACHPQGGLVVQASSMRYAPSPERGRGREYVANGSGLWRIEADGRVRPFALLPARPADDQRLCDVPFSRAAAVEAVQGGLAVEPSGGVLTATMYGVILRFRADGRVERVAGGGPRACQIQLSREWTERGYRDGPADEALFAGNPALAAGAAGEIFVAENDIKSDRIPGNCSLRRIDRTGRVSTVYGDGKCAPIDDARREGHRTPAFDRVVVDRQGRPIVMGADRAMREGSGPDVVYTKVHRIDAGRAELLGRAGHGARFDPTGRLVAIGLAPDGTTLAFNAGYYSDGGLVVPDNGPRFRYWWRSAPGNHLPPADGGRGQAHISEVKDFCSATDGFLYVLTQGAVRRIDPRTGEVTTWLH
jgi:hypothetical protein